MRPALASLAALAVAIALFAGCGGGEGGAERTAAATLCAALQDWIDDVERSSKELSDRTVAEPDPAARKRHFQTWIDGVTVRTEQMRADVGALGIDAPTTGVEEALELLEEVRAEIEAFPEQDSESLGYRIARVFLSMETAFAKVRTWTERLGDAASSNDLGDALVEERACRDYNDPLT